MQTHAAHARHDGALYADGRLPREQTHRIALWPGHQFHVDSSGLGWNEVYTSLATERSWTRTLHALPHIALAYCVHRPALVHRAISGEGDPIRAELRPRQFGTIPHDRESHWHLEGSPDIQLVYLHRDLIDRVAAEAFDLEPEKIELANGLAFTDPLLEQLAAALLDAARDRSGAPTRLYAGSIAHCMAMHLLRQHTRRRTGLRVPASRESVNSRRMRHVCDFIEANLGEDLSVPRLAGEAGVSAHAFGPAFARAMGVTPHAFVLQRRLERAKQLLRATSLPIAGIAAQVGFASQSHLATAFKRATGSTPGQFRG